MKTAPLISDNVHEICTFSTKASNNAQTRVKTYFIFFFFLFHDLCGFTWFCIALPCGADK